MDGIDPLKILPPELINMVLSIMDERSLCCAAVVSKTWNSWANNKDIWRKLCMRKWKLSDNDEFLESERDWKDICKYSKMVTPFQNFTPEQELEREMMEPEQRIQPVAMLPNIKGIIALDLVPQIVIQSSGIGQGSPSTFISREESFCWTTNRKNSWYRVDFGTGTKVMPSHYCLKYGSSANYCVPRHWKIQGSNDPLVEEKPEDDSLWTTIKTHENDRTLNSDFAWYIFSIENCTSAFRYFRVIQTGPNAFLVNRPSTGTDSWSDVFVVSGFDLFGLCIRIPKRIKKAVVEDTLVNLQIC